MGSAEAAHDWTVDIEIGSERISGSSRGGMFLFWRTGDTKYCPEFIGNARYEGAMPPIEASRLRELKEAAVYDAVTKANCDVLGYPIFSWEEERGIFDLFHPNYTVHVRGNPGWIRGFDPIPRENRPGINYFPTTGTARLESIPPRANECDTSRARAHLNAASSTNAPGTRGSDWNNWDEPWGMPQKK